MQIAVTGSTGYLGSIIRQQAIKNGHTLKPIPRNLLYEEPAKLADYMAGCNAVINLAGAPVLRRWTNKNKEIIYASRVLTTRNLAKAITLLAPENRPHKLVSASAIGIYRSGELHDETSLNLDTGFLGKVVRDWEKEALALEPELPVVIFRLGLILGKNSHIIRKQLVPFKLGLGAYLASGAQAFPFVHEFDAAQAFLWAVQNHTVSGIYNLTAPTQITNKEFAQQFAAQLHRKVHFSIPKWIIKIGLGQAASMLCESPAVVSQKLLKEGFRFSYPDISTSLKSLLNK